MDIELQAFYMEQETESTGNFVLGTVLQADEDYTAISRVSRNGTYNGIIVFETSRIFREETNSKYIKMMLKLMETEYLPPVKAPRLSAPIIKSTLQYAMTMQEAVTLELRNSGLNDVVGFVTEIDNDRVKIKALDWYGESDGDDVISIAAISELSMESEDERRLERLTYTPNA